MTQKIYVYKTERQMSNGKIGTILLPIIIDVPQTQIEKKEKEINEILKKQKIIFKARSDKFM